MTDDASLLASYARTRSEEAFAEIVRRHLTLVYSAALRRTAGDLHRAKDVAQIVFTALARDALALSRHGALTGWLYTATRNAAIDLMRTERRRQQREEKVHTMEEILSSPESLPDWERLRPVLDDAMDELDARDREAVLLRFFEGESFAAVGTKLRVNEDAARKRVDRALDKLGALLSRRGITSTSGALALLLANQVAVAAPATVAASITTAALAGVGVSVAGAGAGGIFIMSTSKLITGIAAVVAGVAIGSAIYQAKLSRGAAAITAKVETERDGLRARLAATEKRVQQGNDALAATQNELENIRVGTVSATAPIVRPPASQSGVAMDYVLEHPETHPAFLQQQELRLKARYDRFLKTAQLSDEQKEGFLTAMNEAMANELDLMAVLHGHGYGVGNLPKDPQAQAQFQQLLKENRESTQAIATKIRTALGDEPFKQFQSYASTIPERNVADQMAGQLYLTDVPLTAQQAEQVAQILAQNRFAPQAVPSPTATLNGAFITPQMFSGRIGQAMQQGGMNLLDWPAPVTDAALAKAEAILTPGQFAALKQIQAHQLTQFQLAPPPPSPVKTPANDK
jgi:RNA polymerase sigma factor (sigma-70 family)